MTTDNTKNSTEIEKDEVDPLSEEELKKVLEERQIQAWRRGESKLEYVFATLVAEVVFDRDKPTIWNLTTRSIEVDKIDRILRREEDVINQLLKSKSLIWNRLGLSPLNKNATEIQPEPYRYADLIFLCMTVPHWVPGKTRKNFIVRAQSVLLQYRNDNPSSLIIAITQERGFRLPKDTMFLQWVDIDENLSGIRNKSVLPRLVAQQLTSKSNLHAFIHEQQTYNHLKVLDRLKLLQIHVDGCQSLQTDFNLLIVIHPGLYETHAKKIWQQLRSLQFRSVEVRPQNELRPEHMQQFDFFILVHCGFPESFREIKTLQKISKRIYRFNDELPAKLPSPRKRDLGIKNQLETRYLRLVHEFRSQEKDESFKFIKEKYQLQWTLLQDKNVNLQQLKQLDEKLGNWQEGYFALVEAALLEATQHVHDGSRFGGVMKNLTRYLIVDDYNPEVIEYLVKRKFPRHNIKLMTSIELFQRFNRYKQEHPQIKAAQSYQQFMRTEPIFNKYEVVFVNAWNIETDGTLSVKLRLSPSMDDPTQKPDPRLVKLSNRNLHGLLAIDRKELLKQLTGKIERKHSDETTDIHDLIKKLISKENLSTACRIMGVKKGRLYNLYQIEDNIEKLAKTLKETLPEPAPDLDVTSQSYAFSAREKVMGKKETSGAEKTDDTIDSSVIDDDSWFQPVIQHQVLGIQVVSIGCAIRWQDYADNTKAWRYLEIESARNSEAPEDTMQRALICALTRENNLPEKGFLAAFPELGGTSRFVYSRVLPGRSEMIEPEYALYFIDMRYFQPEEVLDFLRDRNRSPIAHIPILLYVPEEVKLEPNMVAMMGRLIGVPTGEDATGFPMQFIIESLENVERTKHFVQGIFRVDDSLNKEALVPSDFLQEDAAIKFTDDGFPDF